MLPRPPLALALLAAALLPACLKPVEGDAADDSALPTDDSAEETGDDSAPVDADGDGVPADEDCDDADPAVRPGAEERCNGADDDCDGEVDEADAVDAATWYADADADGYGDEASATIACEAPAGAVAQAGDCDDGRDDVFPGAEESFDGADEDCDGSIDELLVEQVSTWTLVGQADDEAAGERLWLLGDIDRDGLIDLGLGLPAHDHGGRDATGALALHDADNSGLGRGATAGWLTLVGETNDMRLGSAVALLGDLDGDPPDELAVGAPWANQGGNSDSGITFITHAQGRSGTVVLDSAVREQQLYGRNDFHYAGTALASGDFDGDGDTDLAIGAPGDEDTKGRIYLAMAGGDLNTASHKVDDTEYHAKGRDIGDALGTALHVADLDGDGRDDVLACAPGRDDGGSGAGACYLIEGQSRFSGHGVIDDVDAANFYGAGDGDGLGADSGRVLALDADGDGTMDLAFGVVGDDSEAADGGAVWVFTGPFSGARSQNDALWRLQGEGGLGAALVAGGDLDEDGVIDLLVGAPGQGVGGEVLLLNLGTDHGGLAAREVASARWETTQPDAALGAALTPPVDLQGDGVPDFAAGAPGYDGDFEDGGQVFILSGRR